MRILIVKLGSIGDIVHTLPSLAAMRRALPDSEISWVVERRSSEILKDNPILDRLIEVDTKALRRGLMSGETLRAPRQQLRLLRAFHGRNASTALPATRCANLPAGSWFTKQSRYLRVYTLLERI